MVKIMSIARLARKSPTFPPDYFDLCFREFKNRKCADLKQFKDWLQEARENLLSWVENRLVSWSSVNGPAQQIAQCASDLAQDVGVPGALKKQVEHQGPAWVVTVGQAKTNIDILLEWCQSVKTSKLRATQRDSRPGRKSRWPETDAFIADYLARNQNASRADVFKAFRAKHPDSMKWLTQEQFNGCWKRFHERKRQRPK
jgi:hypothetical protein